MRETGILLHVSSLPSNYGIGTFGKEAYKFIDFLNKTNQTYWQMLPLGPTSYGDSPYQTFSVNAINPYFIDLDLLVEEGLLTLDNILDSTTNIYVDYNRLYNERYIVLERAFNNFDQNDKGFLTFIENQKKWVEDYAFFMALKRNFNDVSWNSWPLDLKLRKDEVLSEYKIKLKKEIEFHLFIQYIAYKQYMELKIYANSKGVKIIGDIPIYVAYDSSDVWTNDHLFQLNNERNALFVAGVPPDNFSADGQLWGNPLYNWDNHEKENYEWWINRVKYQVELFDSVRIDHFIGFVNYYSIPGQDKTAVNGQWKKGPGIKLFNAIEEKLGKLNIIAEDLGVITDEVRELLKVTGYPGMKLLQFAFDSREVSDYIPFKYDVNTIAYTGTHDNETSRQWIENLNPKDKEYCLNYINSEVRGKEVDSLIKATLQTHSKIAIIPMQDYLDLGKEARMNIPSTLGNNWIWRLSKDYLTNDLSNKITTWVKLYGRNK